ncbi:MAG: glycosyl transferase, family 39 [Actinomycetia bacterium]|nr:glycosyl transferase, family 39 [Actinomycetes bacterium]
MDDTGQGSAPQPATTARQPRSFAAILGAIAVAGGGLRLSYALLELRHHRLRGDAYYFSQLGTLLAQGRGFINPYALAYFGRERQTAQHPPLYSLYLAGVSWLGGRTEMWHRVASCLLGAVTVFVIGLLAAMVAGHRAGLVAAALAALYPNFWANDVFVLSESMTALVLALVLIAAYAFITRPSARRAALLGASIGVAALTRAEAAALLLLLVCPIAFRARATAGKRIAYVAGASAAAALVVAPWIAFNLTRFDRFVGLSTGGPGGTMVIGSCNVAFYGSLIGLGDPTCGPHIRRDPFSVDESQEEHDHLVFALRYIRKNKTQLPVVVTARFGRVWDAFRPWQTAQLESVDRGVWPMRLAVVGYDVVLPLAVAGVIVLRRRRTPIAPLVSTIVLVSLVAAVFEGTTRYRVAADVSLMVLAGVTVDAVWKIASKPADAPRV